MGEATSQSHRDLQPGCLSAPEVTTTLLEYWAGSLLQPGSPGRAHQSLLKH